MMAKFVPDVTTNRWLIIAEGRLKRPSDIEAHRESKKVCVFCPGNEKIPGNEEVMRIGTGSAYEPGWQVRVIKNKYPITDFHEVIVHSPSDDLDLDKLPLEAVSRVLEAFRARYNFHQQNGHVMIFNNVGEDAGASIKHPHSQLVVVPKQISLDSLKIEPVSNIITDNKNFVVYCPEFSQWPFETWITPKISGENFGQITDDAIKDLAQVLQSTLRRLITHLTKGENECHFHPGVPTVTFREAPAYNFYIHYGLDWYLRIIPRLIHRAGFELGTGLSVNSVDPVDAAAILKAEQV